MATGLKLACVLILCLVVATPTANATITCGQVLTLLQPCITYLKSGGTIPPGCCNGVKSLNSKANTTPLRRQVCQCLKTDAMKLPGLNATLALNLPSKCGVKLPYKISYQTNCQTLK